MRFLILLLCLGFGPLTLAETIQFSSGENKVHLLELYSSQGCSSCPPAQNWVNQLQDSPTLWKEVVPVVFHVDYWNYLGWKDPFSKSQFSFRQRAHRREGNVKSVYTPGFVVNGEEWRGWFRRHDLRLTEVAAGQLTVDIETKPLGVMEFKASYRPLGSSLNEPLKLNIALLVMNNKTRVLAGENRARQLEESFIVLDLLSYEPVDDDNNADPAIGLIYSDTVTLQSNIGALAAWVSENNSLHPIQSTGGYF